MMPYIPTKNFRLSMTIEQVQNIYDQVEALVNEVNYESANMNLTALLLRPKNEIPIDSLAIVGRDGNGVMQALCVLYLKQYSKESKLLWFEIGTIAIRPKYRGNKLGFYLVASACF